MQRNYSVEYELLCGISPPLSLFFSESLHYCIINEIASRPAISFPFVKYLTLFHAGCFYSSHGLKLPRSQYRNPKTVTFIYRICDTEGTQSDNPGFHANGSVWEHRTSLAACCCSALFLFFFFLSLRVTLFPQLINLSWKCCTNSTHYTTLMPLVLFSIPSLPFPFE